MIITKPVIINNNGVSIEEVVTTAGSVTEKTLNTTPSKTNILGIVKTCGAGTFKVQLLEGGNQNEVTAVAAQGLILEEEQVVTLSKYNNFINGQNIIKYVITGTQPEFIPLAQYSSKLLIDENSKIIAEPKKSQPSTESGTGSDTSPEQAQPASSGYTPIWEHNKVLVQIPGDNNEYKTTLNAIKIKGYVEVSGIFTTGPQTDMKNYGLELEFYCSGDKEGSPTKVEHLTPPYFVGQPYRLQDDYQSRVIDVNDIKDRLEKIIVKFISEYNNKQVYVYKVELAAGSLTALLDELTARISVAQGKDYLIDATDKITLVGEAFWNNQKLSNSELEFLWLRKEPIKVPEKGSSEADPKATQTLPAANPTIKKFENSKDEWKILNSQTNAQIITKKEEENGSIAYSVEDTTAIVWDSESNTFVLKNEHLPNFKNVFRCLIKYNGHEFVSDEIEVTNWLHENIDANLELTGGDRLSKPDDRAVVTVKINNIVDSIEYKWSYQFTEEDGSSDSWYELQDVATEVKPAETEGGAPTSNKLLDLSVQQIITIAPIEKDENRGRLTYDSIKGVFCLQPDLKTGLRLKCQVTVNLSISDKVEVAEAELANTILCGLGIEELARVRTYEYAVDKSMYAIIKNSDWKPVSYSDGAALVWLNQTVKPTETGTTWPFAGITAVAKDKFYLFIKAKDTWVISATGEPWDVQQYDQEIYRYVKVVQLTETGTITEVSDLTAEIGYTSPEIQQMNILNEVTNNGKLQGLFYGDGYVQINYDDLIKGEEYYRRSEELMVKERKDDGQYEYYPLLFQWEIKTEQSLNPSSFSIALPTSITEDTPVFQIIEIPNQAGPSNFQETIYLKLSSLDVYLKASFNIIRIQHKSNSWIYDIEIIFYSDQEKDYGGYTVSLEENGIQILRIATGTVKTPYAPIDQKTKPINLSRDVLFTSSQTQDLWMREYYQFRKVTLNSSMWVGGLGGAGQYVFPKQADYYFTVSFQERPGHQGNNAIVNKLLASSSSWNFESLLCYLTGLSEGSVYTKDSETRSFFVIHPFYFFYKPKDGATNLLDALKEPREALVSRIEITYQEASDDSDSDEWEFWFYAKANGPSADVRVGKLASSPGTLIGLSTISIDNEKEALLSNNTNKWINFKKLELTESSTLPINNNRYYFIQNDKYYCYETLHINWDSSAIYELSELPSLKIQQFQDFQPIINKNYLGNYYSLQREAYINARYINTGTLRVGNGTVERFYASIDNPQVRIAGFSVNEKALTSGSVGDDDYVYLGRDLLQVSDFFYVDPSSKFASIKGSVEANQGSIGGFTIQESGLKGKNFSIFPDGMKLNELTFGRLSGRRVSGLYSDNSIGMEIGTIRDNNLDTGFSFGKEVNSEEEIQLTFGYNINNPPGEDAYEVILNYEASSNLVKLGERAIEVDVIVQITAARFLGGKHNYKDTKRTRTFKDTLILTKDSPLANSIPLGAPQTAPSDFWGKFSQGACTVRFKDNGFSVEVTGSEVKDQSVNTIGSCYVPTSTSSLPIVCRGQLVPSLNYSGGESLGTQGKKWPEIWCVQLNGKDPDNTSSDLNLKKEIQPLSPQYSQIFDSLQPVSFKWIENESDRTHTGLIAQDVKQAVLDAGLTTQQFAAYCEWEKEDGTTTCGLRYGELIALCIDQIQHLKARVAELEEKLLPQSANDKTD